MPPHAMLSSVDLCYYTARLLVLVVAVLGLMAWASEASSAKPTPVVVLADGDDGLTQRLSDAIETALKSSAAFMLGPGPVPSGALVVRIPTNVDWKRVGGRTKVLYTVRFERVDGRVIGKSGGSCWEDSLKTCAARIVKGAKITSGELH